MTHKFLGHGLIARDEAHQAAIMLVEALRAGGQAYDEAMVYRLAFERALAAIEMTHIRADKEWRSNLRARGDLL